VIIPRTEMGEYFEVESSLIVYLKWKIKDVVFYIKYQLKILEITHSTEILGIRFEVSCEDVSHSGTHNKETCTVIYFFV
jgi:hypothetical protein